MSVTADQMPASINQMGIYMAEHNLELKNWTDHWTQTQMHRKVTDTWNLNGTAYVRVCVGAHVGFL